MLLNDTMLLVEGVLAWTLLNSLVWSRIMSKASPSEFLGAMAVNLTLNTYSVKTVILTSIMSFFGVALHLTGGFLFPAYPLGPSVWPFYPQYSLGPAVWTLSVLIVILVPLAVYNRISIRRNLKAGSDKYEG